MKTKQLLRNQKNNFIAVFLIGLICGVIGLLGWQRFWSIYRLQTPLVKRVNNNTYPTNTPIITPTPTPRKKALIKKVYASERYSYQTALLDEKQKEVMLLVEQRLGKDGAQLVFKESGFHPDSVNSKSGACGLFQAHPCNKLQCDLSDIDCQMNWGENYINSRYGSPAKAWDFWKLNGWY